MDTWYVLSGRSLLSLCDIASQVLVFQGCLAPELLRLSLEALLPQYPMLAGRMAVEQVCVGGGGVGVGGF
jgi:hypothetical protein